MAFRQASSRSHSILFVKLTQKMHDGTKTFTKLCLADLAGSEDVRRSKVTGQAYQEMVEINKSLGGIGAVLNSISLGKRLRFPTYILSPDPESNRRNLDREAISYIPSIGHH